MQDLERLIKVHKAAAAEERLSTVLKLVPIRRGVVGGRRGNDDTVARAHLGGVGKTNVRRVRANTCVLKLRSGERHGLDRTDATLHWEVVASAQRDEAGRPSNFKPHTHNAAWLLVRHHLQMRRPQPHQVKRAERVDRERVPAQRRAQTHDFSTHCPKRRG